MAAVVIAPPKGVEPERYWTAMGPKTLDEMLSLLRDPKSKFHYGMIDHPSVIDLLDLTWDHMEALAEDAARTKASKDDQVEKWRQNKARHAQRFYGRR